MSDAEPAPSQRVIDDKDLFACVLATLSPQDLAAACGAASAIKAAVVEVVVLNRLKLAVVAAKGYKCTLKKKPPGMGPVEYLFHSEKAVKAAEEKAKQAAIERRRGFPMFCDHIRTEAAMRGRLDEYEPRVQALEDQYSATASDAEVERLDEAARSLENEIFMGMMAMPGGMPAGANPLLQLMQAMNGGGMGVTPGGGAPGEEGQRLDGPSAAALATALQGLSGLHGMNVNVRNV